eukprot:g16653.t1
MVNLESKKWEKELRDAWLDRRDLARCRSVAVQMRFAALQFVEEMNRIARPDSETNGTELGMYMPTGSPGKFRSVSPVAVKHRKVWRFPATPSDPTLVRSTGKVQELFFVKNTTLK